MTVQEAITYMESRHRALKSAHAGTDPIFIKAYAELAECYRLATVALIEKQEREKPICAEHDKVYSPVVLLSYPPQYKWICRKCGAEGIDTIGEYADDEYERLKREKQSGVGV